ncbi:hypothetical protein KSP40_PGU010657 [Platanthera guangdongensis]|uniref:Uncharacterized protein n=1 Tax=Platanthera guangdongensis TaxID=2320717 RepID=A0ABR2N423_9ASPA
MREGKVHCSCTKEAGISGKLEVLGGKILTAHDQWPYYYPRAYPRAEIGGFFVRILQIGATTCAVVREEKCTWSGLLSPISRLSSISAEIPRTISDRAQRVTLVISVFVLASDVAMVSGGGGTLLTSIERERRERERRESAGWSWSEFKCCWAKAKTVEGLSEAIATREEVLTAIRVELETCGFTQAVVVLRRGFFLVNLEEERRRTKRKEDGEEVEKRRKKRRSNEGERPTCKALYQIKIQNTNQTKIKGPRVKHYFRSIRSSYGNEWSWSEFRCCWAKAKAVEGLSEAIATKEEAISKGRQGNEAQNIVRVRTPDDAHGPAPMRSLQRRWGPRICGLCHTLLRGALIISGPSLVVLTMLMSLEQKCETVGAGPAVPASLTGYNNKNYKRNRSGRVIEAMLLNEHYCAAIVTIAYRRTAGKGHFK